MIDHDEETGSGYWPSVSDLFITLFIVIMAVLAVIIYQSQSTAGTYVTRGSGIKKEDIRIPTNRLGSVLGKEEIEITRQPSAVVRKLDEYSSLAVDQIKSLSGPGGANNLIADLRRQITEMEEKNRKLEEENARLKALGGGDFALADEVAQLKAEVAQLNEVIKTLNDKPPIIRIDEEREEYRFNSGSAEMGPQFVSGLRDKELVQLAEEITSRNQDGKLMVDTLEIVGHTDGVPLSSTGNLDQRLPQLLGGDWDAMGSLKAGSNNDLGLLRALAVKQVWVEFVEKHPQKEMLQKLDVRCYSAGQTIPPAIETNAASEPFMKENPAARRIEMRLTRLKGE